MSNFPDYYAILSVPRTATPEEIRTAYKRESLRYADAPASSARLIWCLILTGIRTHPDRLVNATPAEKRKATERFQVRIPPSFSPPPPPDLPVCGVYPLGHSRCVFRPFRSGAAEGVRLLVQIQEGAYGRPVCVCELLWELCEHVQWEGTRARS